MTIKPILLKHVLNEVDFLKLQSLRAERCNMVETVEVVEDDMGATSIASIEHSSDVSKGSLFMLRFMHMMIKSRPFARMFLKEASHEMFGLYMYTLGDQAYALEMAKLLDPGDIDALRY
ncbi:hypothetical protein Peur_008623 [Populus x canadensis]